MPFQFMISRAQPPFDYVLVTCWRREARMLMSLFASEHFMRVQQPPYSARCYFSCALML